jgi:hypothetical protein
MGVPEGENRRTLTAELWAVVLGTRPVLKVAVGSLPSEATSQICDPGTNHGTKAPNWGGGAKSRISERKSNGGGGEERGGWQPTLTSWSAPAVARRRETGWKSRLSTGCWSCQLICSVPPRILWSGGGWGSADRAFHLSGSLLLR